MNSLIEDNFNVKSPILCKSNFNVKMGSRNFKVNYKIRCHTLKKKGKKKETYF